MNYYNILGISRFADIYQVKKAYKKLAIELHPDKNSDVNAITKFKLVVEAYKTLSDDESRKLYDIKLNSTIDFNRWGQAFGKPDVAQNLSKTKVNEKQSGANVLANIRILKSELNNEIEKTIEYDYMGVCNHCSGSCAKTLKKCCDDGCEVCKFSKYVIDEKCDKCVDGLIYSKAKLKIIIPMNVNDKDTIKVAGRGCAGKYGAHRGDLIITIFVVDDVINN